MTGDEECVEDASDKEKEARLRERWLSGNCSICYSISMIFPSLCDCSHFSLMYKYGYAALGISP